MPQSDPPSWGFFPECAAAVTPHTAVGIDDNLASGYTRIAHRTTNHKTPGRVDINLQILVHHVFG